MTTAKPNLVWLLFTVPLEEITLLGVPTFLHACGGYKLDISNWFNLSLTVSYALAPYVAHFLILYRHFMIFAGLYEFISPARTGYPTHV